MSIELAIEQIEKKRNSGDDNWPISYKIGVILSRLVEIHHCSRVLEVGTSIGFSSLFILKALRSLENSKLFTIEINSQRFSLAEDNFRKAGVLNLVQQIQGEVFEVIEKFDFGNKKFDCVFLDAAQQSYCELVEKLFEKKLIGENCIFLADNVLSHSYMKKFIDFMVFKGFEVDIFKIDSGLMLAKKK